MNLWHLCLLFSASLFLKLPAWGYSCHVSLRHISYLSSFHPHSHLLYPTKHCSAALWSYVVTSPRFSKEYWHTAEYRTVSCCQTFTKKYARWNDGRWCLYALLAVSAKSSVLPSQWEEIIQTVVFSGKRWAFEVCFVKWCTCLVVEYLRCLSSPHWTLSDRLPSHECKSLNSIWHHLLRRLKQMRQWVACLW